MTAGGALLLTSAPIERRLQASSAAGLETGQIKTPPASPSGLPNSKPAILQPVTTRELPADDKEVLLADIQAAAITYDPASLPTLAGYLDSADAEVRAAAADGIVLLGDGSGAGFLRQAAKRARNKAEAADWQAKADYLDLPPVSLFSPEKIRALREAHHSQAVRDSGRATGGLPRGSAIPRPGETPQ
jgi:hypothetical protein